MTVSIAFLNMENGKLGQLGTIWSFSWTGFCSHSDIQLTRFYPKNPPAVKVHQCVFIRCLTCQFSCCILKITWAGCYPKFAERLLKKVQEIGRAVQQECRD